MYFVLIIPYEHVCFLMRDRKGVDLDERRGGEELGGAQERKTRIREFNVRKKKLFSIK